MAVISRVIKMASSYLRHKDWSQSTHTAHEDIMVFDIDYCLYQSENIEREESERAKAAERTLLGGTGYTMKKLKKEYGSTKRGLSEKFGLTFEQIKSNDFMDCARFLRADYELQELLYRIPLRKFCLTNAFKEKAEQILEALGVTECFERVYCADDADYAPEWILKPCQSPFLFVMTDLKINPRVTKVYFFDDSPANIKTARKMGWKTVQVTREFPIHSALRQFICENGRRYGIEVDGKASDQLDIAG